MTEYLKGLLEGSGVSLRGISQNYRSLEEVMDELVEKWSSIPLYAKEDIAQELLK